MLYNWLIDQQLISGMRTNSQTLTWDVFRKCKKSSYVEHDRYFGYNR